MHEYSKEAHYNAVKSAILSKHCRGGLRIRLKTQGMESKDHETANAVSLANSAPWICWIATSAANRHVSICGNHKSYQLAVLVSGIPIVVLYMPLCLNIFAIWKDNGDISIACHKRDSLHTFSIEG